MAAFLAPTGAKLRAHAKTHKSPVIALQQMRRGAVGQCVQKVAEAEALAWGGVPDILVSNEVVSPRKLARLLALSGISRVALCADPRRAWRWRNRRQRRRASGCGCWWRSMSAPAAAACRRGRRPWPWRSASPPART
ncbi:hypothetical protein ACFQU7_21125 [Pseudoroseomonas wenyumeiae]